MPQIKFASGAVRDLQRLRNFLQTNSPVAAQRAAQAIVSAMSVLGQQPQIGRPAPDMPAEFREWVIDFGDSGYVARYRVDVDGVTILAVRHQKETGF